MLLLASALRGIRLLVIAAAAFVLAAIAWTTVLRLAAAPAPGQLSAFLWALGTPLLRPFDSLVRPARFFNGGTFSWTSLMALLAYALSAAVITWALARASDGLFAAHAAVRSQSFEELEQRMRR